MIELYVTHNVYVLHKKYDPYSGLIYHLFGFICYSVLIGLGPFSFLLRVSIGFGWEKNEKLTVFLFFFHDDDDDRSWSSTSTSASPRWCSRPSPTWDPSSTTCCRRRRLREPPSPPPPDVLLFCHRRRGGRPTNTHKKTMFQKMNDEFSTVMTHWGSLIKSRVGWRRRGQEKGGGACGFWRPTKHGRFRFRSRFFFLSISFCGFLFLLSFTSARFSFVLRFTTTVDQLMLPAVRFRCCGGGGADDKVGGAFLYVLIVWLLFFYVFF